MFILLLDDMISNVERATICFVVAGTFSLQIPCPAAECVAAETRPEGTREEKQMSGETQATCRIVFRRESRRSKRRDDGAQRESCATDIIYSAQGSIKSLVQPVFAPRYLSGLIWSWRHRLWCDLLLLLFYYQLCTIELEESVPATGRGMRRP